MHNLGDDVIVATGWFLIVEIAGPVGLTSADVQFYINAVAPSWDGETGTIIATLAGISLGALQPAEDNPYSFSFTFKTTAPVGDYSFTIFAGIP